MEKQPFLIPDEFRHLKSTFVRGATGPSFIAPFKFNFEEEKTVEEVLDFLDKKGIADKGISIFIDSERRWINFVFRKFKSTSLIPPEAEISIDGKIVDIKIEIT